MFKRPLNPIMKKILQKQYKDTINADNIVSLSRIKINKIFDKEEEKIKEIILHNLINEWWEESIQDEESFKLLKRTIRKTKIKLNQVEKHNLFLIEERLFSLERHIKILDVSEKLLKKEVVGVKFVKASIYEKKKTLRSLDSGDLLLTNRRVILLGEEMHAFFWINITDVVFGVHGFEFKHKGQSFVIRIHDQITLNNTIKNFTAKKVAKWNH